MSISAWIAKDSQRAARHVLGRVFHTFEQLKHFPHLSQPGRVSSTRERVVPGTPYIVVFEVWLDKQAVVVTAVAHGKRDRQVIPSPLKSRQLPSASISANSQRERWIRSDIGRSPIYDAAQFWLIASALDQIALLEGGLEHRRISAPNCDVPASC